MRPAIVAHAPAKLNLALSVGPPSDEDAGLHPICSWMVTVDLRDELLVTRLEPDRLSRYAILWHDEARRRSDIDWSITRDLAVRAHRGLESRGGTALPVQLKVAKRIPVGGGLGGGSSNAAAMLRATNALFELGLDDDALAALGGTLGSDVPFLVRGGSAIVAGTGGAIDPAPTPELDAVLVLAEIGCPTGAVYAAYDALGPRSLRADAVRALAAAPGRPDPDACFNDLAEAAMTVAPKLRDLAALVRGVAEAPVHVAGSGSSLFVLCDDPMHAEHLAAALERAEPGLVALPVRAAAPSLAPAEIAP